MSCGTATCAAKRSRHRTTRSSRAEVTATDLTFHIGAAVDIGDQANGTAQHLGQVIVARMAQAEGKAWKDYVHDQLKCSPTSEQIRA